MASRHKTTFRSIKSPQNINKICFLKIGLPFYKPSDWSNAVVYNVTSLLFIYSLFVLHQIQRVNSEPTRDKAALLAFISQIPHENRLKWNRSDSACNWAGVKCDSNKSHVYKLQIPGTGLVGPIPPNTLGNLTQLRVLSLHANKLTSPLPPDFSNLKLLRGLYLQNNKLSGEFPPSLPELTRLTRLYISNNNFTGTVPKSLNKLTRLTRLLMQNNHFSGPFPDINPRGLTNFNVSNNNLSGSIPNHLTKFPLSSFSGNKNLCGGPLKPCPPNDGDNKSRHDTILSKSAIIAIAVAAGVVLILVILCVVICYMKNKQESSSDDQSEPNPVIMQPEIAATAGGTGNNEGGGRGGRNSNNNKYLVFVKGGEGYDFDLEDLLRASAEVLGKGSVGTSYKAVLEEGPTVVVKRLQQQVVLNEGEFQMQMEAMGRMNDHHHVVPLRAFYYSKDEKLLVSDHLPAGSLSARLHGSGGSSRHRALNWDSRIRIATTAARGLAHLHESGNIVHGNIKSSNILLHNHDSLVAAISDYGLNSLFDESATPGHRIAGYRAPEVIDNQRVTFKSDVFSFGVLLLEILTGKAPNQATLGDEAIDLPRWVQSVVSEESTSEIFDEELMRYNNNNNEEEEMVKLLQMAMALVAIVPDQRPTMPEVVRMLEDMDRTRQIDDS